jgi:hypothetical protein
VLLCSQIFHNISIYLRRLTSCEQATWCSSRWALFYSVRRSGLYVWSKSRLNCYRVFILLMWCSVVWSCRAFDRSPQDDFKVNKYHDHVDGAFSSLPCLQTTDLQFKIEQPSQMKDSIQQTLLPGGAQLLVYTLRNKGYSGFFHQNVLRAPNGFLENP